MKEELKFVSVPLNQGEYKYKQNHPVWGVINGKYIVIRNTTNDGLCTSTLYPYKHFENKFMQKLWLLKLKVKVKLGFL